MNDEFARIVADQCNDLEIGSTLLEVCHATRMSFVALARITEERWIAAHVVGFGLDPGGELKVKGICDDIRQSGQATVIVGWVRSS